jgi:2-keto-4-pentenoate hydratase/2-oxohepta-3-ene-1,7-dioic acid hydratase in catechol pathway
MKLVRYRDKEGENYGVLMENKIVCLPKLAKLAKKKFPKRLEEFVTLDADGVKEAEKLIENAGESDIKHVSSLINEVSLLAPIASPPKIICLGLNYRDHAAEQNASIPDEPIIFLKPHTTIIGPKRKDC